MHHLQVATFSESLPPHAMIATASELPSLVSTLKPVPVLVVGQTPPPYGGQALMTKVFLDGNYHLISIHHIRLSFSSSMGEIGKFRLSKIFHLFTIICKIWKARFQYRTPVLYYMPAGPDVVPMLRDVILLLATRWCFQHTVFHFHAAGLSELYKRLPRGLRFLFRQAYFDPDLAIQLSEFNPPDGRTLRAKKVVVIPNGIQDHGPQHYRERPANVAEPAILFVGVLRESKGVMVLLEACKRLQEAKVPFRVRFMGQYESDLFRNEVETFLAQNNLQDKVEFLGVLKDGRKWDAYAQADLLCFPSHFESESFGNVLVEAMMFRLPVVATRWRGIPSIVVDGETGSLVPIKNPALLAEELKRYLEDAELRRSVGEQGRQRYLQNFTLESFYRNMEQSLASVMEQPPVAPKRTRRVGQ